MRGINKLTLVLSKFCEVLHWLGSAGMLVLLAASFLWPEGLRGAAAQGVPGYDGSLDSYGFEIAVLQTDGTVSLGALRFFAVGAICIMGLMAMVFRNTHLILKTAQGKTWFAKGESPFQQDIIRMLKEIGIFLLSVPAVGLVMNTAARLVLDVEQVEMHVGLESVIVGLLVLCLTDFFRYGARLENDVDGLL